MTTDYDYRLTYLVLAIRTMLKYDHELTAILCIECFGVIQPRLKRRRIKDCCQRTVEMVT